MRPVLRLTGAFVLLAYASIAAGDSGCLSLCIPAEGDAHLETNPCSTSCDDERSESEAGSCAGCVDYQWVCKAVTPARTDDSLQHLGATLAVSSPAAEAILPAPPARTVLRYSDRVPDTTSSLRATVLLI